MLQTVLQFFLLQSNPRAQGWSNCIWVIFGLQQTFKTLRLILLSSDHSFLLRAFRFVTWLLAKSRHAVMFIFFRSGFLLTKESAKSAVLKILMSDQMLCNVFSTVSGLLVTHMTSSLFLSIAHASFICSVTMNLMCVGIYKALLIIYLFVAFLILLSIYLRVPHHRQIF